MQEWITQVVNSEHAGIMVLAAVFLMGIIGVVSCGCNFAIIGVVAGYTGTIGSTGKTRSIIWSGVFFLLGTIISMAAIGALIGYTSKIINASFGIYWQIGAGLFTIFFGLMTLGFLPFKMPGIKLNSDRHSKGIFSSVVFGFTVGGLATAFNSCCNPVFPIVLAASFVKGSVVWGMLMLVAFALGYGLPLAAAMIGIGLGFGKISKTTSVVGKIIKYAGGTALILLGFYFLLTI